MESSPAPSSSSLSRKELQSFLKLWKCKATGTTETLRSTYESEVASRGARTAEQETVPPPVPPVAANAESLPPREKRLKRYREKPTTAICQRIDRARTQRLYLVQRSEVNDLSCDFVVLGSTGNVYNVRVSKIPKCSCPDHARGNLCKHILFVMLKVIGLDPGSPLVYQAAYLDEELGEIFSLMLSRRVGGSIMANDQVKATYAALITNDNDDDDVETSGAHRKSLDDDDSDCPICFDRMDVSGNLTYCRAACGTNFHADCIQRWLGQQNRTQPTCPNCRQPWETTTKKIGKAGREGFTNLGALQGQSLKRDTSTYSTGSRGGSTFKKGRYDR